MGEIDDILKEIKAEFTAEKKPQPQSSPKKVSPSSSSSHSKIPSASSNAPLDSLIAEVKKEFESGKTPPSSKSHNFLKNSKTFTKPKEAPSFDGGVSSSKSSKSNLIKELQQEYQKKEQIKQKQQQQEEQRRREALRQKAQQWLNDLDLNTDEGLWFEEFSYSYDSKLAAAMDYLAAIRE